MILLDNKRILRTIRRIAYQIAEEAHGSPIHLVGLNERGYAIAKIIKPILDQETDSNIPLDQLDALNNEEFIFNYTPKPDSVLVLIDDVIFSGGTLQVAIDKIPKRSIFQKIFIAVLVDRGHRKYPVHAEVVGIHTPTKLNEQVDLELKNNKPDNVILKKI